MGISLRDERGQGIVEYVLVLVVAVSIILGSIYQLNSAFKVWANNYFGTYLACLLETGELPTISGTGGDSGICNQLFKPFSLSDGRPLRNSSPPAQSGSSKNNSGGSRETHASHNSGGNRGPGGGPNRVGTFNASNRPPVKLVAKGKGSPKQEPGNNANSGAPIFAGGYNTGNHRLGKEGKTSLDQRFAFDDTSEKEKRRSLASTPAKASEVGGRAKSIPLRNRVAKKGVDDGPSSAFSISNFLWYLIIGAIIIAIIVVLGGQALQIGKSMDS